MHVPLQLGRVVNRITAQSGLSQKITKAKGAEGVAQAGVYLHLPSKQEALNSNPSTTNTQHHLQSPRQHKC
jgi:hypothetical protein